MALTTGVQAGVVSMIACNNEVARQYLLAKRTMVDERSGVTFRCEQKHKWAINGREELSQVDILVTAKQSMP